MVLYQEAVDCSLWVGMKEFKYVRVETNNPQAHALFALADTSGTPPVQISIRPSLCRTNHNPLSNMGWV